MKKQKGFTLIELLVVIAIIGVMASLVVVNLSTANMKSRDSRRKADLSEVRTALELYYDDFQAYPTSTGTFATDMGALTTDYMQVLPVDPRNTGSNVYSYTSANGSSYTLGAVLEVDDSAYTVYGAN